MQLKCQITKQITHIWILKVLNILRSSKRIFLEFSLLILKLSAPGYQPPSERVAGPSDTNLSVPYSEIVLKREIGNVTINFISFEFISIVKEMVVLVKFLLELGKKLQLLSKYVVQCPVHISMNFYKKLNL